MTNDTQKAVDKIHIPFCNSRLDLGSKSEYHLTVMHCFVLCQVSKLSLKRVASKNNADINFKKLSDQTI